MPIPGPPQAGTRQTQVDYYATILEQLPGTYQGNMAQYRGQTWAGLYVTLAKQNPDIDLVQLGNAVLGVETAQRIGQGIGAADTQLGNFVTVAGKAGAASGDTAVGHVVGDAESVLSSGQFLANLANPVLWLRVAKVAVGTLILVVGLAKLTGADKTAGGIAAKAVKAAPLL